MNKHEQPGVIIFRKHILPYSETFIVNQGQFLQKYAPYYTGFQRVSSGASLLEGTTNAVLEDYGKLLNWEKLKFRLGWNKNHPWIQSLRATDSKLIHAHFATSAIDAMELSEILNIPFVATVHGNDITTVDESASYIRKRKKVFEKADKIIAVSHFIQDQLIKKGCPPEKIVQHYIGINIDQFSGVKKEAEVPTILFVGRLVEKKGCRYLLEATKRLQKVHPELQVNIVGDGPLRKTLEEYVSENKLNVNFLGIQTPDQIKELMQQAWVFSTPSITAKAGDAEGLGMVFLEAQALQTPVVTFGSGGVVEAIRHEESGFLCKEKDVDQLTEALQFLLDSQEERQRFGEAGRRNVEEHFDIVKQCQALEGIYDSVVK
ncbi:glycosyltransferase [Algivirga pacifica]|uniref:Glycosyltransferase n=1 Tax=Algivirga pacifica TaxID=1162670 RepID=A0ABP9D8U7_9BACT